MATHKNVIYSSYGQVRKNPKEQTVNLRWNQTFDLDDLDVNMGSTSASLAPKAVFSAVNLTLIKETRNNQTTNLMEEISYNKTTMSKSGPFKSANDMNPQN